MGVLDEILAWSVNRPPWQRDALRRLVSTGEVDSETIRAYADTCIGQTKHELVPLAAQHIRASDTAQPPVAIVGICETENVNSLAPDEHLTFASSGLTIVYGDNASGKSGYARLLKAVTRTRASERVRNNIFGDAGLEPTATIQYQVGPDKRTLSWRRDGGQPDDLSLLSFFDRACNDVYLSKDTEVAFRPFGLDLFDELVVVCEAVRSEIDSRSSEAGRRTAGLPAVETSTEAGQFLVGLKATTTDKEIKAAGSLDRAGEERKQVVEEALAKAREGGGHIAADGLDRMAGRAERLTPIVTKRSVLVSAQTRDELFELRNSMEVRTKAADLARAQALGSSPLPGVGEAAWRRLWEAAREYSEGVAYPAAAFPVVDNASCVLCQQPLLTEGSDRLRHFEGFVADTTQQAADAARSAYQQVLSRVTAGMDEDESGALDILHDLRAEDAEATEQLLSYLSESKQALIALDGAIRRGDDAEDLSFPAAPIDRLDRAIMRLRERASELRKGGDPEGEAGLASELKELTARKALADSRDAVIAERQRLRLLAACAKARTSSSTKAVTQKSAELTSAALTEVLMDRFSRETDRLGLENVVLRTVGGRRGVLMYRTGFLDAKQEAPLPEVLSEGEQTALGMAGFLAEVWTDASRSGVIFDDPVNSLDHARRDKVAERLVQLAAERQTIVFTHDVAFVLALKKHSVLHSVEVTERSVERLQSTSGHCEDFHKFSARLVKERLKELETDLQHVRDQKASMTSTAYGDATSGWYRKLRRTWERAIEETLVGGVLTRDDLQIHPAMVRTLILFTAADNKQLQHGYGRATELSESHDESALINTPSPEPDDMASDLEVLRAWHKRIAARSALSEQKIYEAASESSQATAD